MSCSPSTGHFAIGHVSWTSSEMTNELSLACVYDSRIHGDHSQEIGDAGLFGLSCCLCQPQLCLTRGFFGPYYERYEGCPPAGSLDLHDRCSRVAPWTRTPCQCDFDRSRGGAHPERPAFPMLVTHVFTEPGWLASVALLMSMMMNKQCIFGSTCCYNRLMQSGR